MPVIRFKDVIDEFENVDDLDVLDRARTNVALAHALSMSRPRNWHGTGLTPEQILPIATVSGIPVAWIPPAHVLQALVAAAPEDHIETLLEHEVDVVREFHALLDECTDPWVGQERVLIGRAVAAYEAGFHEAAQALAVAVGEPLAIWASEPRVKGFESEAARLDWESRKKKAGRYGLARLELGAVAPGHKLDRIEVLRHSLVGPVGQFFTPFHAGPGEPLPPTVSRHATVHQPSVAHLSRSNSLLALMLAISILRQQQDWAEEVRMDDVANDGSPL